MEGEKIYKALFSSQKVELGAVQDFEKAFNKANDNWGEIGQDLIKALAKAEAEYKKNIALWKVAEDEGERIVKASKELGIDVPKDVKIMLSNVKPSIKEVEGYLSSINKMYGMF